MGYLKYPTVLRVGLSQWTAAATFRAIMEQAPELWRTAGGKMKGVIWDLVKDIESVINKNGNKPSEKRCVCRFCENPLQGGPNVFQAHHRVYGTGKKTVKLCKSTPADVKARLRQQIDVQHVAEHR
jgi:hypothetical protein